MKIDGTRDNQPLGRLLLLLVRAFEDDLISAAASTGYGDVTASDLQILHYVNPEGSLATEISRLAGITKQAVGKAVASLEARGYLTRKRSRKDARAKVVVFTARGERLLETGLRAVRGIEKAYEKELGASDYAALRASLVSLVRLHRLARPLDKASRSA